MDEDDEDYSWLLRATVQGQREAMKTWFFKHFEEPSESLPYSSDQGGYQWIWGSPADPRRVLEDEFYDYIPGEVIEAYAYELIGVSYEWSPIPGEDFQDELDALRPGARDRFEAGADSLADFNEWFAEPLDPVWRRLLYAHAVTHLEAYLSDRFLEFVFSDRTFLRLFLQSFRDFSETKVPLSKVLDIADDIDGYVRRHLAEIVWHNLPRVEHVYRAVGVALPRASPEMQQMVAIRHDLVHRNGRSPARVLHLIESQAVDKALKLIRAYVGETEKAIELASQGKVDA